MQAFGVQRSSVSPALSAALRASTAAAGLEGSRPEGKPTESGRKDMHCTHEDQKAEKTRKSRKRKEKTRKGTHCTPRAKKPNVYKNVFFRAKRKIVRVPMASTLQPKLSDTILSPPSMLHCSVLGVAWGLRLRREALRRHVLPQPRLRALHAPQRLAALLVLAYSRGARKLQAIAPTVLSSEDPIQE